MLGDASASAGTTFQSFQLGAHFVQLIPPATSNLSREFCHMQHAARLVPNAEIITHQVALNKTLPSVKGGRTIRLHVTPQN